MHAIGFTQHLPLDDPQSLRDLDLPKPTPAGRDLLVAVDAVSVNPVDLIGLTTKDATPDHPVVLGWDAVGTVDAVGPDVTLFKPGDRVFYSGDFNRAGSDADYQLIDERIVGNAPKKLGIAESAAMPLTAMTAWEALFEQLGIDPHADNHGKTILVINGAGGVGSVATQLAHWAGLTVIATASRPETIAWTKDHGTDAVVNHRQDIVPQVRALGHQYVDYILELSNLNQHWAEIVDLIKPSGKIVSITGSSEPLDLVALKRKRATFAWEWMFTKAFFQTDDMLTQHHTLNEISRLLDSGELTSTLTKTITPLDAEHLRQAFQLVASHKMMGKVVLKK